VGKEGEMQKLPRDSPALEDSMALQKRQKARSSQHGTEYR
jgi:hypothetical protein